MKEELTINFNGKDYVEYLKYKDTKKIKWTPENKKVAYISACFLWVGLLIMFLVNKLTYVAPIERVYTWEGIGMFLAIMMGLAWLVHGFGFILIRR